MKTKPTIPITPTPKTGSTPAVYLVLYDQAVKLWRLGLADLPSLDEERASAYDQEV